MTTPTAERLYLAQHMAEWAGKGYALYNPRPDGVMQDLPVIYGFNNGGSPGWYEAVLIAEDGACLGSHICSHEGYMLHDLGILTDSRSDRHETFRAHYPDGYRMDFVPFAEVRSHAGLTEALRLNRLRAVETP